MKLFFNAVFMLVGMCWVLNAFPMQQDLKKSLNDSLVLLHQKLTILENALIQEKSITVIKPLLLTQEAITKAIEDWVIKFEDFETNFLDFFILVFASPEQVEKDYDEKKLTKIFDALEKPLRDILVALQNINSTKLSQNDVDRIFLFKQSGQFNDAESILKNTTAKLHTFIKMIRDFKQNVFQSGAKTETVRLLDQTTLKIVETTDSVLKELKQLEADYKPVVSSQCLVS